MGAINTMTERYNVQASTILGENYKITNIEASDYNPTIDDYITVTITVNDVYGDSVEGENVTVTATEGTFAQLNGSDITSASSVTGTTNSSGQFTLTYACSVWGLIDISANNVFKQINVTGFKRILYNATYALWVDESTRTAQIRSNRSNVDIAAGESFVYSDFTIPATYRPLSTRITSIFRGNAEITNFVYSNGGVGIYNGGSARTGWNLNFINEWHY